VAYYFVLIFLTFKLTNVDASTQFHKDTFFFLFIFLSIKMPAAIKITVPKLSANTKPYANALKFSIAAQVTGAKLVETPGEALTFIVSNDISLTDANAALK
jgi:hypothetical protein